MPRPGWYPDPAGSGRLRYWDGGSWTGQLRDRAVVVAAGGDGAGAVGGTAGEVTGVPGADRLGAGLSEGAGASHDGYPPAREAAGPVAGDGWMTDPGPRADVWPVAGPTPEAGGTVREAAGPVAGDGWMTDPGPRADVWPVAGPTPEAGGTVREAAGPVAGDGWMTDPGPVVQPGGEYPPAPAGGLTSWPVGGDPWADAASAPGPGVPAGQARVGAGQAAGYVTRAMTWLLDLLVLFTPAVVALFLLQLSRVVVGETTPTGARVLTGAWSYLATGLGLVVVFSPVVMWLWNYVLRQGRTGQTYAKSRVGIALVDINTGLTVGVVRAFIRAAAFALMCAVVVPGVVDLLWPLWDPRGQRLVDKLARTQVRPLPAGRA